MQLHSNKQENKLLNETIIQPENGTVAWVIEFRFWFEFLAFNDYENMIK